MKNADQCVVVSGAFDDIRSSDVRFLQEAARLGPLHVLLWDDASLHYITGADPKFPENERLYFLKAIRFVSKVSLVTPPNADTLSFVDGLTPSIWVVQESEDSAANRAFCESHNVTYQVLTKIDLAGFPDTIEAKPLASSGKKVLVTGCYDWFHSGHVRFFEEVSERGDLYVVVGHDANVRALKGEGHPMFSQEERRYMAGSIRYVKQALISTGRGWLDAEPELKRIKPDIYAVNEDGDKPEKKKYCQENGIKYMVLKRLPKAGLPKRESTVMRGFWREREDG
ncbi:MAG: adenylyltransferase/cytidyltransferase family protein [Sedimentisphaerales bacterium]|nr:adenylyltransferase/cytidyltransferase family protein [Sedimentisphaerales bacterium]